MAAAHTLLHIAAPKPIATSASLPAVVPFRATPAFNLPAPFVAHAAFLLISSTPHFLNGGATPYTHLPSAALPLEDSIVDSPYAPAPTRCLLFVSMAASANPVPDARRMFDEMPHRNAVSWGAMVSGYTAGKSSADAFELFRLMLGQCPLEKNEFVATAVLSAVSVPLGLPHPPRHPLAGVEHARAPPWLPLFPSLL